MLLMVLFIKLISHSVKSLVQHIHWCKSTILIQVKLLLIWIL